MKKVGFILGIAIAIIAVFIFENKLYYPSLPIENLSAKEAIDKLKESESKIAEIAVEGDSIWYIISSENQGISSADEYIKQLIGSNGWEFKDKDGAGLFFEKDGRRLIATTQMWTGNYVLVKIPDDFK
ncbi:hypothetical protein M3172_03880 [Mesobacillus subterraneus]|uniref:hypothetical protein n=1 Tax=Mesobacillus subterraneus TaxID=285983 RepID=UPI0020413BAB|nr:hypothetical protein [Mesobacillus subterraneus]MCM3572316.1 hypothetical protein [Mesobacillus subterraneus]